MSIYDKIVVCNITLFFDGSRWVRETVAIYKDENLNTAAKEGTLLIKKYEFLAQMCYIKHLSDALSKTSVYSS